MAQVNLGHVVGPGVPTGGTAGQVLKKNGSTNFDASWATLNGSMVQVSASDSTTVQQSLAAVKSDMGIVEDGNTATHTIAAGQYVIWKGALYTASAAIPSGTTLSTSNLTAVSDGGLNSLNGKFQNMLYVEQITCVPSANLSANQYGYFEVPVTYARRKNIISTMIAIGHPGVAGGYTVTGKYMRTLDVIYLSYFTPRALGATNADFTVEIVYTDYPVTLNSHSETVQPN